jgi:hypothetical protein
VISALDSEVVEHLEILRGGFVRAPPPVAPSPPADYRRSIKPPPKGAKPHASM